MTTQRRPRGDAQPFDQRFLLFMLASVTILMFFTSQAPPPVEQGEDQVAEADQPAVDDADVKIPAGKEAPEADGLAADTPDREDEEVEEAAPEPLAAPELATLGSVDANGAHRLLLTLDNVGAGVRRIELSSDSYRDLENRTGYLGQLALTEAEQGGALVQVVGSGSPAEAAGIQVGDLIQSAKLDSSGSDGQSDTTKIVSADDFDLVLEDSKPGQTLSLEIQREDQAVSLSATLGKQPLNLIRPEAENVRQHSPKLADDYKSVDSFLVRLTRVGGRDAEDPELVEANRQLVEEAWSIEPSEEGQVVFSKRLSSLGIEIIKRFTLTAVPESERTNKAYPGYHFELAVELKNLTDQNQLVAYELTGPNGLPIEGFWYVNKIGRGWSSYGLRDVVARYVNSAFEQFSCRSVLDGDVKPMGQGQPLAFVGVDAQYFASIIIPKKQAISDLRLDSVRAEIATASISESRNTAERWENASCVLERKAVNLEPSAKLSDDYQIFAGPKLPALLKQYQVNEDQNHSLQNLLYYGWFGPVARIMLGILHFFNGIVGNYGIAIIMLTVLVRGALFPLSRQQAKNMLMMQKLKPEMDQIAKKYKDDLQKRSEAQQALFKKHNYNPAAGCLPMFLQLPIFLGLYRALAVDVELRQAPLFSDAIRFCSNLAAPDMFYDWSGFMPSWVSTGEGTMSLGPYFNLLPLATIALFILQQKMFMPPATDDQTRLQQKMMQYMMIFMGFLFFKVPSGLCIYFIASSLWGVGERKLLPKAQPVATEDSTNTKPAITTPKPTGAGSANAKRKPKNKKRKK